jgi:stage II sporulation protein D
MKEVENILKKTGRKKFFLFLGICIFLMLIFSNSVLATEKQPILRVGIFLNQTEITISGDGTFKIYNLKSNGLIKNNSGSKH